MLDFRGKEKHYHPCNPWHPWQKNFAFLASLRFNLYPALNAVPTAPNLLTNDSCFGFRYSNLEFNNQLSFPFNPLAKDLKMSANNPSPLTPHPPVAVIGSGYWGKNLIRNHHQIGSLKLICDNNETVLASFKEQYPNIETCVALSDVMSRNDIKGVVIATPAETHYSIAREALLAGKHVYAEKPLVLDEKQGEDLITLSEQQNRVLMVGHLLQYHPAFVRLRELASKGELGRINYIYSHRLNLGKIRREENILWSFAPHDISMILSLAGETPDNVHATGGYYLHKKIADVTTTHMEFPSGLQAHIFVSWLHPFKEQKLVVVGDKKMAVFDDTQPWEDKLLLYGHQINWKNNMPVPVKAEPERVNIEEDEPLKLECLHFLDCMSSGKRPITDGSEGLQVLRVLNAAQHSLDHGAPDSSHLSPHSSPPRASRFTPHPSREFFRPFNSDIRRKCGSWRKNENLALHPRSQKLQHRHGL